ncbi:hypothetical protein [Nonomuraea soli]|uniref:WD40 repeat domain-containing protein n=1 Tax=Nonomuraea soli TaxID=1032476 RepID=A0A7W0CQ34_9ACTN|nr:hypothetical protein [Nonomuraea soli]MBA2895010.1 hypothetical protein [Nonomuraea soli]
MRHTSWAAAALAAAAIGWVGAAPAHAGAQPPATAAWMKGCEVGDGGYTEPCGRWRLVLGDGSTRELTGAAPRATTQSGGRSDWQSRLAISADGRWVLYERDGDHRLMVRRAAGGAARALPASLVPKGVGTENVGVWLSPKGDRVMVSVGLDGDPTPTKVITVSTGKTVELPADQDPEGFSADGDEVLAGRYRNDNVVKLYGHRLGGGVLATTPPQVVAGAYARALAADGRTLAVVVAGNEDRKLPPRLRLYDLVGEHLTASVTLPLLPSQTPSHVHWTADGKLVAHVSEGGEGAPVKIRVLTFDVDSGAVEGSRRLTISKHSYTWALPGE